MDNGHWITIKHSGITAHIFLDNQGHITKGPHHLLGASINHLPPLENLTHHSEDFKPEGYDTQPHYSDGSALGGTPPLQTKKQTKESFKQFLLDTGKKPIGQQYSGPEGDYSDVLSDKEMISLARSMDQHIPKESRLSLKFYSYKGDYHINNWLRDKTRYKTEAKDQKTDLDIYSHITSIDNAFKVSRIPRNTRVYRGLSKNIFNHTFPGQILEPKGYISTTMAFDQTPSFLQDSIGQFHPQATLMIIDIPKNTPAICMRSFSHFPDEEEVLLGRNTRLKILAHSHMLDYSVLHCEVLLEEGENTT